MDFYELSTANGNPPIVTKTRRSKIIITNNTEKKTFIVYSQKMAGYLMQRGFVLVSMQPDLKKTGRNVFFFNDTPQLKMAVDAYMSR